MDHQIFAIVNRSTYDRVGFWLEKSSKLQKIMIN